MSKRLAVFCCLAFLCLLFCACGKEETPREPELVFRYADNQPEGYPTTMAAEYFANLVSERTEGRVAIRIYADGKLGNEISVFRQMQFGGIDFARISVSTLAEFIPEMAILHLPYLFEDSGHMWRVLDGVIGEELLEIIRREDVIGLSWFDAGDRNIYTRERVASIEDLKGMKIRVQESDFQSRMVSLWGAIPVQVSYEAVYSALQTGKIDGAENNWPSYEATGHFEAAPYYLLDGHSRLPEVQLVSRSAYEKISALGEGFDRILLQCARESALYERELWSQREKESEELVRSRGCVVTKLSDEELGKFREAAIPLYESFTGETAEMIEKIRNS